MISHDKKLIFIHIPKCGGRSVCNAFNQRFDHFTMQYYWDEYQYYFQEYTKFTIVRHPLDRLVSMYHYIKNHRRHAYEPIGNPVGFQDWLHQNISANTRSFDINSPEGERGLDYMLGSPFWFSSQERRLLLNGIDHYPTRVFKFENGFEQIEEFLETKLNHENKSSGRKPWREYFTTDDISVLRNIKFIKEDLDFFKYEI